MELEEKLKEEVVKGLVNHALDQVRMRYGSGEYGVESKKRYHNEKHSKLVIEEAKQLGVKALENGKIKTEELPLLIIAAAYHDLEQDMGSGENERISAKAAVEMMTNSKLFTLEEIKTVETVILSTEVSFATGVMEQPFTTVNYMTQLIADADLANLGQETSEFWRCTNLLMKEVFNTDELTTANEAKFLPGSESLLTNHKYFTEEARVKYPHQSENLKEVQDKLLKLKPSVLV